MNLGQLKVRGAVLKSFLSILFSPLLIIFSTLRFIYSSFFSPFSFLSLLFVFLIILISNPSSLLSSESSSANSSQSSQSLDEGYFFTNNNETSDSTVTVEKDLTYHDQQLPYQYNQSDISVEEFVDPTPSQIEKTLELSLQGFEAIKASQNLSPEEEATVQRLMEHMTQTFEDSSTPEDTKFLLDNVKVFDKARTIFLRGMERLSQEQQRPEFAEDHEFFNKNLQKSLFVFTDIEPNSKITFTMIQDKLVASVFVNEDPSRIFNFFLFDDDSSTSVDESNEYDPLQNSKTFFRLLDKFTNKQHMAHFNTTNIRLASDLSIVSLESSDFPKFFSKGVLRWLREYWDSIYEKPHIGLGLLCASLQVSATIMLKYWSNTDHDSLSKVITDNSSQLLWIAVFASVISTFAGTYRNYIDRGSLFKRVLKGVVQGALFGYVLYLLDPNIGVAGLSIFSIVGISHHFRLLTVLFTQKLLSYPITFFVRTRNDTGSYGQNGELNYKLGKLKINKKTLETQLLYVVAKFSIKIAALLGLSFSICGYTLSGDFLYLFVPVVMFFINKVLINYWHDKLFEDYATDLTSSTTKKQSFKVIEQLFAKNKYTIAKGFDGGFYALASFLMGITKIDNQILRLTSKQKASEIDSTVDKSLGQWFHALYKIFDKNIDNMEINLDKLSLRTRYFFSTLGLEELKELQSTYQAILDEHKQGKIQLSQNSLKVLLETLALLNRHVVTKTQRVNILQKVRSSLEGKTLPDMVSRFRSSCTSWFSTPNLEASR